MPFPPQGPSLLSAAWHHIKAVAQSDVYYHNGIAFLAYDPVSGTIAVDKTRPTTDTRAAKIVAQPDGKFSVVVCHHQKFIGRDRLTHPQESISRIVGNQTRESAGTVLRSIEMSWCNQHFRTHVPA